MGVCVRELEDGRVCREHGPILDTRPVRDEQGRAIQRRILECPACGLRLQSVRDDGPTVKRRVNERLR